LKRIIYSDILKTVAILGVIIIHISSARLTGDELLSTNWICSVFWGSIVRWSVPVFFMCSGIVFLDINKQIKTKRIYKKYIPKLLGALVLWAFIYEIAAGATLFGALYNIFTFNTHYHLYFIYIMILAYAIVPIIRVYMQAATKRNIEYVLCFWLFFAIVFPFLKNFYPLSLTGGLVNQYIINFAYGLIGYMILGHYVNTYQLKKKTEYIIYILGILGFLVTFLGTVIMSKAKSCNEQMFFEGLSPNVFVMALAVFLVAKKIGEKINSEKVANIFFVFSKSSFTIYLCHDLVNSLFRKLGVLTLPNALFTIPLVALGVFLISFIFYVTILKLLPIFDRFKIFKTERNVL